MASMLRYAGSDLSHVLIADTRNHTKHCRYIVNPPGVDAVVHQHVGVGEGMWISTRYSAPCAK